MKDFQEILLFSNEFTFYDLYKIETVLELNHVGNYIFIVLPEIDFLNEECCFRVLGVLSDKSLMLIKNDVKKLF